MRIHTFALIFFFVLFVSVLSTAQASEMTAGALTLKDRMHFQRAIEQVYWNHRIRPKENAAPKPSLNALMPEAR